MTDEGQDRRDEVALPETRARWEPATLTYLGRLGEIVLGGKPTTGSADPGVDALRKGPGTPPQL